MSAIDGVPDGAVQIGVNEFITWAEYQGQPAGVNEYHLTPQGARCAGWVPFRGYPWSKGFEAIEGYQSWDVVQLSPLTLEPSIKCRACGHHGYIRNGAWVPA